MAKRFVVENTRASGVTLPKSTVGNIEEKAGLKLLPGENGLSPEYWKDISEKKPVKFLINAGILKPISLGEPKSLIESLDDLSPAEAAKFIAASKDVQELKGYLSKSEKAGVKKALKKRIDDLMKA